MRYFTQENDSLVWRNHGETLAIAPWGENSLRVRSAMMHDVEDTRYALLEPAPCTPEVQLGDTTASITNGKLTATLEVDAWHRVARITFLNQRGETLLREIACGGALALRARAFQPILGGDHRLTVSFDGNEDERLYGMGQYQQDTLDVKHCTFELAHRNSQASVPFVMSSLGYGFLWHNPAIGEASFGKNRSAWKATSTKQMDYWITAEDSPAEATLSAGAREQGAPAEESTVVVAAEGAPAAGPVFARPGRGPELRDQRQHQEDAEQPPEDEGRLHRQEGQPQRHRVPDEPLRAARLQVAEHGHHQQDQQVGAHEEERLWAPHAAPGRLGEVDDQGLQGKEQNGQPTVT